MKLKKAVKIILCAIIALVCITVLGGYLSALLNDAPRFWSYSIPFFHDTLGIIVSNFDMTTLAIPICGICLMLLYIDIRRKTEDKHR